MKGGAFALCLIALAACTEQKTLPACEPLEFEVATCTPLFPPEFDRVYDEVLTGNGAEGCATASSACHSNADASGARGGLVFAGTRDEVYAALALFVDPDPSCGPFAVRINSHDKDFVMPPGQTRLSQGARCSIAQWIDAGALR